MPEKAATEKPEERRKMESGRKMDVKNYTQDLTNRPLLALEEK